MFDPSAPSLDAVLAEPDEPEAAPLGDLDLLLRVRDPELVEELLAIAGRREREEFALAALRIGVLSLRTARGQVDSQALRGEVERMLAELRKGLEQHQERHQLELGNALRGYFDPRDGRFEARVQALVKDDGEIAQVIRRHVEGSDSALARTLALHVGAESPLLRVLDPQSGEGLAAGVQRLVEQQLATQRERILAEFSLDNREGALARLVAELTQSHGRLSEDLQGRIAEVVKEFSLDAEDSALSRLVSRVEHAQRQITAEFTLDSESSALARLRRELLAIADRQHQQLGDLQKRVEVELAKLSTGRERDARSTAHGDAFEQALLRWLERRALEQGDLFEATGRSTGLVRHRRKGDAVVQLGPEHRAAGARIVVEAKEDAGTTLALARVEIEEARKNRGAEVGVFVLSARSAGDGWPAFHVIGEDLFVTWDAEDLASDVRLEAALAVARALATRGRAEPASEVDLRAFEGAIRAVEKQLDGLGQIDTSACTIENGAARIRDRARIMRDNLLRSIKTLDDCCEAARREAVIG
jgi:hypothetical protein